MSPFPAKAMIILGGGRVGRRAVALLAGLGFTDLTVVDPDPTALAGLPVGVARVRAEGAEYLAGTWLPQGKDPWSWPSAWIIPAAPAHLAWRWLLLHLQAAPAPVPGEALTGLPGLTQAGQGGYALSFAPALCPENCDEQAPCPQAGGPVEPLYDLLRTRSTIWPVLVLRSFPLAPGLGGYPASHLFRLARRTGELGPGLILMATACRCHAVVHGLTLPG
jgi:hypothetical protein